MRGGHEDRKQNFIDGSRHSKELKTSKKLPNNYSHVSVSVFVSMRPLLLSYRLVSCIESICVFMSCPLLVIVVCSYLSVLLCVCVCVCVCVLCCEFSVNLST